MTRSAADAPRKRPTDGAASARGRLGRATEVREQHDRLLRLEERLRATLVPDSSGSGQELADRLSLIARVSDQRADLLEQRHTHRLGVLARIQESIDRLHETEAPDSLIERAPREICRSCGFSRALISGVRGSTWVPQVVEVQPADDPKAAELLAYVAGAEIPLRHMMLETQLVRRRAPVLISDVRRIAGADRGMIAAARSRAYVAAPIMPAGRVIGFLHADRFGRDGDVDLEDRDNLWAFAQRFGLLFQRSVLSERLVAQHQQLHDALRVAQRTADHLHATKVRMQPHHQDLAGLPARGERPRANGDSRLDTSLTRRELEIVRLMASGATNATIAATLVIAEGTVKSHVKRILRKLHARSRAECVARYLNLTVHEQPGSAAAT